MKKIIYLLFLIQSGFMTAQSVRVPTINGKKVQINSNSLSTADNGLTVTANNMQLGGALTKPSVLTTTSAFTLAITGLQTGASTDQIVSVDANGVLRAVPNNNWSTKGNAGTVPGTNFIGTTDNVDLVFKRGSVQSGLIQDIGVGRTNTSFGYQALNPANKGAENSAFGVQALAANTTGKDNVAFGYQALLKNTTGYSNLAVGGVSLAQNIGGYSNIGHGYNALTSNTSGKFNIAIGDYALQLNQADNNIGIGMQAIGNLYVGAQNTGIGIFAFNAMTNGSNNVAMGYGAAAFYLSSENVSKDYLTKLSNSVLLGTDTRTLGDNELNTIIIGSSAVSRGSNTVQIGNEKMTSIGGQVAWSNPSDVRLKKDVVTSTHGLDFVSKLRPVTYRMKTGTTDLQSGFIAQEVEAAAKAVDYEFSGIVKPTNESEFYSLRYSEFVVPLVKAVQEQQQMLKNHEADIAEIKVQVQQLLMAAK